MGGHEEKCKTCERSWEHECSLCQRLIVSRPLCKHGFNSGAHTDAEHVSSEVGVSEQPGWGHQEQPQDVQASRGLKLRGTNSQRMLVWNVQLGRDFLHFYQEDLPGCRDHVIHFHIPPTPTTLIKGMRSTHPVMNSNLRPALESFFY